VAAQAAEGLYRAHSLEPSIVHRDVKPENIFLHRREASHDSIVKVMDFGVAAVVGADSGHHDRSDRRIVIARIGDRVHRRSEATCLGGVG
jgi:serine/threonine protein kinase